MRIRPRRTPRQDTPDDVGTLWTMQRREHSARCALMACMRRWELRVIVDNQTLLAKRCARADEAFELAERWKHRMIEKGWRQVVPRMAGDAQPGVLP